jgi:acyl carrier protein phosphodiesterase
LVRYGTIDGLTFTFSKMANRASKPKAFYRAVADLQTFETELNENFKAFFPDLQAFVELEMIEAIKKIEENLAI